MRGPPCGRSLRKLCPFRRSLKAKEKSVRSAGRLPAEPAAPGRREPRGVLCDLRGPWSLGSGFRAGEGCCQWCVLIWPDTGVMWHSPLALLETAPALGVSHSHHKPHGAESCRLRNKPIPLRAPRLVLWGRDKGIQSFPPLIIEHVRASRDDKKTMLFSSEGPVGVTEARAFSDAGSHWSVAGKRMDSGASCLHSNPGFAPGWVFGSPSAPFSL